MSLPENQHTEILSALNETAFIDATVMQINKDLQGLFPGEIRFENYTKSGILDQLCAILQPVLQALSKAQPELLSQFIYRVDLDEKKFIDSLSRDLTLGHLALLIIEREAFKVWLRLKFS